MRIYVAGHTGLVGRSVTAELERHGHMTYTALEHRGSHRGSTSDGIYDAERGGGDLRSFYNTDTILTHAGRLDGVVVAAARVGGIGVNASQPIRFLLDNVRIATNLIELAHMHGIERLVNLGSSCIYPRDAPQPMTEAHLLSGLLEPTNEGYALAKIVALKLTEMYRVRGRPYYTSLQPTNLYGPGDTYDAERSHVIPALVMRFANAVQQGVSRVVLWGSGTPLREFLYVDDLASAVAMVLEGGPTEGWMNVGSGQEVSIAKLAQMIAKLVGYDGEIEWDRGRPDGMPRKLLDSSKIRAHGWHPSVDLQEGLRRTIEDYKARFG